MSIQEDIIRSDDGYDRKAAEAWKSIWNTYCERLKALNLEPTVQVLSQSQGQNNGGICDEQ
jgi:hypothetical protein